MNIKDNIKQLHKKIRKYGRKADGKIYRQYAPLALLYQLTVWERLLQKLPIPSYFWPLPQWSCQLQYTNPATKAIVIWDLEELSYADRQSAQLNLANILKGYNIQVAIVTGSSDFQFFISNGWLVEYIPLYPKQYAQKKLAWLAIRYKNTVSIPLILGKFSTDEIMRMI